MIYNSPFSSIVYAQYEDIIEDHQALKILNIST